MKIKIYCICILTAIGICCILYTIIPRVNKPLQNFEYLWNRFNETYALFERKHVNWDSIYVHYNQQITPSTNNNDLFQILVSMLQCLEDEHVYIRKFNKIYFSGYNLPPLNYFQVLKFNFRKPTTDFSLRVIKEKYLINEFKKGLPIISLLPPFGFRNVLHYGWLTDSIAYIHISEMRGEYDKVHKVINDIFHEFKHAKAYIIDIRDNIGGYSGPIQVMAERFTDQNRLFAIKRWRSTKSYNQFSEPEYLYLTADAHPQYSNIPVVLLVNRNTQSAAELFTFMMGTLPNVTIVGDTTMGIFSDTYVDHLPNGWEYRISITKTTDHNGKWLEDIGIAPDVFCDNSKEDLENGKDKVLDLAIELIQEDENILLNDMTSVEKLPPLFMDLFRSYIENYSISESIQRMKQNNKYEELYLKESELNELGYDYLNNGEVNNAILVFELNAERFPDSWNVYDSLAEAFQKMGDKGKAITYYLKALKKLPNQLLWDIKEFSQRESRIKKIINSLKE